MVSKVNMKYLSVLLIIFIMFLGFGCLGDSEEDISDAGDLQNVDAQNVTVVQVQEDHDATMWDYIFWSSMWHNYGYMSYYNYGYMPYCTYVTHTVPVYHPVYIRATVPTTVYQVKDTASNKVLHTSPTQTKAALYTSTVKKQADNLKIRAAQRSGTGFGSDYTQTVDKGKTNYAVKNANDGDKPKSYYDNSKNVKDMKQNYKNNGYQPKSTSSTVSKTSTPSKTSTTKSSTTRSSTSRSGKR
jgi:hypothetical protein